VLNPVRQSIQEAEVIWACLQGGIITTILAELCQIVVTVQLILSTGGSSEAGERPPGVRLGSIERRAGNLDVINHEPGIIDAAVARIAET